MTTIRTRLAQLSGAADDTSEAETLFISARGRRRDPRVGSTKNVVFAKEH